jgi:hypothetical protein
LVAPVILEVVRQTRAELKIEYPIKVTEQLQGILDYFLRSQTELLLTTGEIWRFASINRAQKHITKGLELYRIPEELETLLRILIQVLGAVSDR